MLLHEHPSELTADFYRFYGDSPRRLWAAGVPLSDIADCAVNLPADSATFHTLNPEWEWDIKAQLLALLVDEERASQVIAMRLKGVKNAKYPKPIPRPGVASDGDDTVIGGRESALPIDEMALWLGQGFEFMN